MASLLQTTNTALLAATEGAETPPDCSLEPESDLSSWQLDLEGIQLVEYNTQLSKKLILYTNVGKKDTLAEISASLESPFPTELSKVLEPECVSVQKVRRIAERI